MRPSQPHPPGYGSGISDSMRPSHPHTPGYGSGISDSMRPSHPHTPGYGSGMPVQYLASRGPHGVHQGIHQGGHVPGVHQGVHGPTGHHPGIHGVHQRPGQHIKYYPSLSGSETDVSTSTENLTQEERYVLRNMERQEPQGEEQHHQVSHQQLGHIHAMAGHILQSHGQAGPSYHPPPPYSDRLIAQQIASNNARREALRLDAMIAASRQGTPIGSPGPHMNGLRTEDLYGGRVATNSRFTPTSHYQPVTQSVPHSQETNLSRLAPSVYSHPSVTDPILKSPKSFYQDPSVLGPKKGFNISSSGAYFDTSAVSKDSDLQVQNDMIAQLTREMRLNNNGHLSGGSDVESSGSTSTLNNPAATAERIAALALQAKVSSSSIPVPVYRSKQVETPTKINKNAPPPPYSSPSKSYQVNTPLDAVSKLKVQETRKMSAPSPLGSSGKPDNLPLLSCSQPDLANLTSTELGAQDTQSSSQLESLEASPNTRDMFDTINNENRSLKAEVELMRRRINRLDNLEKEMLKIHEAYQALREHSEKRELLEKSARTKLQAEILNNQEINKELRERHDAVMAQIMSGDTGNIPGLDSILRGEILRKDALITQLANQNKELLNAKERQEVECAEQRETLQEQRTHIDVLDSALSSAQNNVLRLEDELRQKEAYAERVKQMTKSLEQLQAASEKREAMEKKLRVKLEEELKELRAEQESRDGREDREGENVDSLARKLSESEEKIIRLESEKTQWEQRYLEESAMRQVAIDAASFPKDAKIAVLEKNSAESEKKIAEARSEKLKQMAEVQAYQRRMLDLEISVKSLESALAERNALVKVLQKKAFEKPTDTENVLSIPIHDTLNSASSILLQSKQLSTSHVGSPLSHSGNHASQHSTPVSFSSHAPHHSTPVSYSNHASQHSTPVSFASHASQRSTPVPFSNHASQHSTPVPFSNSTPIPFSNHASQHSTPLPFSQHGYPSPVSQYSSPYIIHSSTPYSMSQHGVATSHASQLSTPLPLGSPRHAVSDFYEGISSSMSSTARGPLGKFSIGGRVRSGSPANIQRSATPSDMLRSGTPTNLVKQIRRDSAPGDVFSTFSEAQSPGKTLINTSDLYGTGTTGSSGTQGTSVSTGGTLPKMSFAAMKEENSRTLPTKNYASLAESLRSSYPDGDLQLPDKPIKILDDFNSTRKSGNIGRKSANLEGNINSYEVTKPGSYTEGANNTITIDDDSNPDISRIESEASQPDESVNSSLLDKDSLLLALKQEKEKRPENFWRV